MKHPSRLLFSNTHNFHKKLSSLIIICSFVWKTERKKEKKSFKQYRSTFVIVNGVILNEFCGSV